MGLKDMLGTLVGVVIGGEAIHQVGAIGSGMSSGMKSATQSFIGLGIMGQAAKGVKSLFFK